MGHVGLKTRSFDQFLEKPCAHCRGHSFDPICMKLCQNVYLNNGKARIKKRSCWVKN